VTDITKHACFLYEQKSGIHIPYVVVQTANSVSAFTSNMAPVFIEGVKRTLPSRYPDALICDLEILRDAPMEMTLAGVGDMVAVFVSLADWYLASILGMDDTYNPLPQTLLQNLYEVLLAAAADIRQPTPHGMEILAKVIALGGLAMSLAHATTPLSGYEHVISHILDLINERMGVPLAMHGTQVSLATILVSRAYQIFLEDFNPQQLNLAQCFPTSEHMQQLISKTFAVIDPSGAAASECWADYSQKLEKWRANQSALADFVTHWQDIKQTLQSLTRPAQDIERILQSVQAPLRFSQCQPPQNETKVRYAFMTAPLMRKRLTLGDVLIFFRWDRDQLWQQIWSE
ncbi:MAG: iron-containing alcohol dehydrogenase, partial [Anaerolineales bacterium]